MKEKHHLFRFGPNKFMVSKQHLTICPNFKSSSHRNLNSLGLEKSLKLKEYRQKN